MKIPEGFKTIIPKVTGATIFICPKGHRSNYLIGLGLLRSPYKCPQCTGHSNSVGKELHKLNDNRKRAI